MISNRADLRFAFLGVLKIKVGEEKIMEFYKPSHLDVKADELARMYFDDMRLTKDSIVGKYLILSYTDGPKEYSLPDEWEWQLNAINYSFKVGEQEAGVAGSTNHITRTVTIAPKYENDDTVLLHELIHVFEGLYNLKEGFTNNYGDKIDADVYPFIRDALLLALYNDLRAKIPDLDSRILAHANIYSGTNITNEGGNHDILFFLKSLDLDLRLGYKLGTVCGYGREDFGQAKL